MQLIFTPIISNDFNQIARQLQTEHLAQSISLATYILQQSHVQNYAKLWHRRNEKEPVKLLWPLKRYVDTLHDELMARLKKDYKIFDGVMKRCGKLGKPHPAFVRFQEIYNGPTHGRYVEWPDSVLTTHWDWLSVNFPQHYPVKERPYSIYMMPPAFVSPFQAGKGKHNKMSFFKETK